MNILSTLALPHSLAAKACALTNMSRTIVSGSAAKAWFDIFQEPLTLGKLKGKLKGLIDSQVYRKKCKHKHQKSCRLATLDRLTPTILSGFSPSQCMVLEYLPNQTFAAPVIHKPLTALFVLFLVKMVSPTCSAQLLT